MREIFNYIANGAFLLYPWIFGALLVKAYICFGNTQDNIGLALAWFILLLIIILFVNEILKFKLK